MDEKLKYRLVGASVILALAVFFLPMILDSEKYRSQIQSQIPAVPSEEDARRNKEQSIHNIEGQRSNLNGPVEKGPLVINLDDSEEETQKETVQIKEPVAVVDSKPQEVQTDINKQGDTSAAEGKTESTNESALADNKQQPTTATEEQKPSQSEPVAEITEKPAPDVKPAAETVVAQNPEQNKTTQATKEPQSSSENELAFSDSAWLIQIGSFSNKENATRLVNQLRGEGYRAYQRVGDGYARVYVGPYPVKGEADKRTSVLEKLVGAKVKVIEFDPKQH
ncbi:SPOR domain-containing protein [Kangiella sp.]|uniref:SPOR domain-containing protein n=1 Tax=Kangiella sp. TaxID=1920245 RepID=UPI0019C97092|nr:SPOR domain-containing protein [Kangiella sp.]MBD3652923.1 SPOR domain-containing protein [Kangiella sp.]